MIDPWPGKLGRSFRFYESSPRYTSSRWPCPSAYNSQGPCRLPEAPGQAKILRPVVYKELGAQSDALEGVDADKQLPGRLIEAWSVSDVGPVRYAPVVVDVPARRRGEKGDTGIVSSGGEGEREIAFESMTSPFGRDSLARGTEASSRSVVRASRTKALVCTREGAAIPQQTI